MEREACVCDHGYERSDLCAEIIIIICAEAYALTPQSFVFLCHVLGRKSSLFVNYLSTAALRSLDLTGSDL